MKNTKFNKIYQKKMKILFKKNNKSNNSKS